MSNEDLLMMTMSFFIGAISMYLVIYRDNLVAMGNLIFAFVMITILVGFAGVVAALGMVGVAFVFVCYLVYLVYLKVKAEYHRRKRG